MNHDLLVYINLLYFLNSLRFSALLICELVPTDMLQMELSATYFKASLYYKFDFVPLIHSTFLD